MLKDGNIVLLNSNRLAFEGFQRDMAGEAEKPTCAPSRTLRTW
jgi:hypothetical protein